MGIYNIHTETLRELQKIKTERDFFKIYSIKLEQERDEHEQARAALEEELVQVILERDEAFARGKQVFEDLRRVEADHKKCRDRLESLEQTIAEGPAPRGRYAYVADKRRLRAESERDAALDREQALARKLAVIELTWDRCEGVPTDHDRRKLHRVIIETEPHVNEELSATRAKEEVV